MGLTGKVARSLAIPLVTHGRPLEAKRSLFPDWLWLCDESSPHGWALHIPVQILAEKFKMEFLLTVSLTKAIP